MWNTTLGNKTRQTMKFVLKQYDTELLSFDLRSEGVDGFVCTILKKNRRNSAVCSRWGSP